AVVDDLHHGDRDGVRGDGEPERATGRNTGAQDRRERQGVAEAEREHDRDRDRGGVAPREGRRNDHPEHLADRTPGQAVERRLDGGTVQRRRFAHGYLVFAKRCTASRSSALFSVASRSSPEASAPATQWRTCSSSTLIPTAS